MHHHIAALAVVVTLAGGDAAVAQTAAVPQVTAEADPGVRLTRLIDRAEVRLSRIELQPGAVRRVHAHDDVVYHLWVPISGSLEITIAGDAPVAATNGQAFFMKRGTSHGFRNVGTTPAALFEIFIKETTTAAAFDPADTARALLAAFDLPAADGAPAGSPQPRRDESRADAAGAPALLR
jgi:mannose-6-phosphate isomerase-like protein (cupin superfamily)